MVEPKKLKTVYSEVKLDCHLPIAHMRIRFRFLTNTINAQKGLKSSLNTQRR
jgi:hypothetical protein